MREQQAASAHASASLLDCVDAIGDALGKAQALLGEEHGHAGALQLVDRLDDLR